MIGSGRSSQLATAKSSNKLAYPPNSNPVDAMASFQMVEKVEVNTADGGLEKVLALAKVHASLVQLVKDGGIENLMEFSSYFSKDKYEQEAVTFRDQVEALKGKQIEVGRLRVAIEMARAVLARPPDAVEPQPALDIEAPLKPQDKADMMKAWDARYGIRLTMWLDPADNLVNRLWREFRNNTPTMIPVSKIRSVYTDNNPHPEKKVILHGGVSLTLEGYEKNEVVRDIAQYYFSLRILANASAKAGNYEFESRVEKDAKVVFAPLDVNQEYADHAFRMALKQPGSAAATLRWLEDRDHHTRGTMVNLMRSGFPQGEALTKALKDSELKWASPMENEERPMARRGGSNTSGASGSQGPSKPKQKMGMGKFAKSQSQAHPVKKDNVSYASMMKGGKKICRAFNMGNCQDGKCPYGGLHVCSVVEGGRTCGGKHAAIHHSRNQGR